MDYFPAFLKIRNRPCLLVGGGSVATRKARMLLAAGAKLTVIAPQIGLELRQAAEAGDIRWIERGFESSDINGFWLVVSATGVDQVDAQVQSAAEDQQVFCNVVDRQERCSYITPAIVDRSPLMVAVSSGGAAPVLARKVRSLIDTQLSQHLGHLAGAAGRWREAVKEALPEFAARLRFWEGFFSNSLNSAESGGDVDRLIAESLDSFSRTNANTGEAWLVGAGPGDPELLTIKAVQAMQSADVILHDRLVSADVLALARKDAEFISVGKTPGCKENGQQSINQRLVSLVASGKRVCRLKGGDPFIFGRGGEEAAALDEHGLAYTVVPGITAAAGCAAAAGIPLTHRDAAQSVVLLTGHGKDSVDTLDWVSLARDRQTLAVYMGVSRYPEISRALIANGRAADTPIAIIEKGTTPEQRTLRGTLGQLAILAQANRVTSPAMLIIGEVAAIGRQVPGETRKPAIDANLSQSAIQQSANY